MGSIKVHASISQILQKLVVLDDGKPINMHDYKVTAALLDAPLISSTVLYCGRQIGKSILLSLFTLKYSAIPRFRTVYVSPSDKQLKDFSRKKL